IQITIGRVAASRCLCYDLRFFDQGGRGGHVTGQEEHVGALDQGEGKLAESAGFPGKPDVSAGEGVPPVVVPQGDSSNVGYPQPTKILGRRGLPVETAERTRGWPKWTRAPSSTSPAA